MLATAFSVAIVTLVIVLGLFSSGGHLGRLGGWCISVVHPDAHSPPECTSVIYPLSSRYNVNKLYQTVKKFIDQERRSVLSISSMKNIYNVPCTSSDL
ncbi:hypothetical protein BDV37DRAFT_49860 [Aspergillus pseudonomiae]|uniref:Uncharacterized protein n=1 Tax=Aspergillus pseudonomiae TaxID=1506151 RepID=A0A5N7CUA4_9EURO|nr:uncharacterized protein BDV37DRAFT_49860 [Aspergillus pseudonomiae]KAE8397701.1 hypothetical protein BDV37DRAFT_49860 [Aspergillus pseudonomiae]